MKKLSLLVIATALCIGLKLQAQITVPVNGGVPQAFPYSSQVRDAGGNLLANRFINIRITMHIGSEEGEAAYIETDTVTTSPNGIFSVVVGGGMSIQGAFQDIPWAGGEIYQQIEIDENGGTHFVDMGTTQLLSLPYAITAGNGISDVKYDSTGRMTITTADGESTIKATEAIWKANGNTSAGNAFVGTTDNTDLVFKRQNTEAIRVRSGNMVTMPGKVGLGNVAVPVTTLDIDGGLTLRDNTINVSSSTTVTVGNRGLIFLNSTVLPSSATISLTDGLQKGQIVVFSITGASGKGVRFVNNGTANNTRVNIDGGGVSSSVGNGISYSEGNTLTLLWNGTDWVQMSSSIGKP